jgi:hypothetical protein
MDYTHLTAPCGLDCFNCPLYLANENPNLRSAIAKNLNVAPENAVCRGCRNEKGAIPVLGMTGPCNVYRCIQQKNFEICSDCPDFPCDHLHPYADRAGEVPPNTKVFNLCLIKKMGLEAWARQKARSVKETYFKNKWRI